MSDEIELEIPARAELLQLVRLTAGVVAARAGLGLDDIEDLRLGVEELCLSLLGPTGDAPGRLALRYAWDDEVVAITCTLVTEAPPRPQGPVGGLAQELSSQILDALVDEHGTSPVGATPQAWLKMRRHRSPPGSVTT
jgi:hypothetical protein